MLGRRRQSIATMALAVVMLVSPVQIALADSSGGFEYTITTAGTATITDYTGPGGAVTVPSTLGGKPVTRIGFEAFANKGTITSVVIPNSVTNIGEKAFAYCDLLESAVLSSSIYTTGKGAFRDCEKLASVTIPFGAKYIDEYCFQGCSALTSVIIPSSVEGIEFQAFAMSGLTSLTIPSTVKRIIQGAFARCDGLTSMTIPGSVTDMQGGVFMKCANLKSVTIAEGVTEIPDSMFWFCTSLTDVSIPNSVEEVGGSAFKDCTSLEHIVFPESVTRIGTPPNTSGAVGGKVFEGCTSLTDVTLPSSVPQELIGDRLIYSTGLFKGCTSLKSVILPEGMLDCYDEMFAGCTSLTDVTIPDSVTLFGDDMFTGCTALTNITIPDSVQWLGDSVFKGCTSLAGVVIPMGVDTLRSDAFAGCTQLTSVAIPSSVTSIEYRVFEGCSKLVSAYFSGSAPAVSGSGSTIFAGCPTGFKVYFHRLTDDPSATGWPTPPATWSGRPTAYFQNTDPYFPPIGSRTVTVGSPVTFDVNATDADGDTLTYSLASGAPVGAKMDPTTGVFTWIPAKAQAGRVYDIKVLVTDGRGGVDSDTPKFTVVRGPLVTTAIQGNDRYLTAIEASKKAFAPGSSEYVVIATGADFPDALGGAALAGALKAPLLLTPQNTLPAAVGAEITRLGARKAIILGGTGAVSDVVKGALATKVGGAANVERIAGTTRYETANAVAARTIKVLGAAYCGTAFIATGANFPDALGASPLAAAKGWPIYLANPTQGDNAALINAMKANGVKTALVLGGTGVVADSVKNKAGTVLGTSRRLNGDNRYTTAIAVATYGVTDAGLSWDKVAIATGEGFPDALSGGALQGRSGSVMLLTPGKELHSAVHTTLTAKKASIFEVRFLGGTGAVSAAVRGSVGTILK